MKISLKFKLLATVGLCVITLSLANLYNFSQLHKAVSEREIKGFEMTTTSLVQAIAAQFYERYGDVQAFAINSILWNGSTDEINSHLNKLTKLYGIYDLILVTDATGKVTAINSIDPLGNTLDSSKIIGQNFAHENWFLKAQNGEFTKDEKKGFNGTYFEDAQFDAISESVYGKPMWGTIFSAPIKNNLGEFVGVISTRANFKWVEQSAVDSYQALIHSGNTDMDLMMLNKEGKVILDFEPVSQKDISFVERENEVLGKMDFYANKHPFVERLKSESSGFEILTTDLEGERTEGVNEVASFARIDSPKFISDIGWVVFTRTNYSSLINYLTESEKEFTIVSIVVNLVGLFLSAFYFHRLSHNLNAITNRVNGTGKSVEISSEELLNSAKKLSTVAQQQASSIQETSASLTELAGMVAENVRHAEQSTHAAEEVMAIGQDARASMGVLSEAMDKIQEANIKIETLAKVIEEIGEKTEVIDEIVFKTQLLSFNASVEAERAGEHGRGFAVVAQEVGNLAQMSGKAATEIAGIVKRSIREADQVARENGQKVAKGAEVASETRSKMDKVISQMEIITESINKIAIASKEQSTGLNQISLAVEGLNQTTQETASSSETVEIAVTELQGQSGDLNNIVTELSTLVSSNESIKKPKAPSFSAGDFAPSSVSAKVLTLPKQRSSTKSTNSSGGSNELGKAVGHEYIGQNQEAENLWEKL